MAAARDGRRPATGRGQAGGSAAPPSGFGLGEAAPVDPAGILELHARLTRRLADLRQDAKDAVQAAVPPLRQCRDPLADAERLRLPPCPAPRLSILIAAHDRAALTVACLLALAEAPPACAFEVLLVDDGSREPAYARLAEVEHLTLLRLATNRGFLHACNAGFPRCRGEFVLLLNNDAQALPGAIDRLVAALDADPGIGAAGGKVLYPDGRLQEAGCSLHPDGESGMVGLFADPDQPAFCYDRDVAYCSGAALLLRRAAVGETLFDPAYAPAYCEDADLCLRLRDAGHRIRYVAGAVFVHQLSASGEPRRAGQRHRLVARNQARLQARWGETLAAMDRVRPIAFFLPQFHPTAQNDAWWGAGFTEWTNVVRAQPSFVGHYQPHLPADLGFYDLRVADTLRRQAALAARYGVEGFCVYHYDFGAERLLGAPMAVLHANPDIAFRHCLCWANENWTRNWDGGAREILVEQSYDPATLARVAADAVRHAGDPRYLRVDGCPLFLVYRPLQLPDAAGFAALLRAAFAAAGFAGVHLAYVESMEAAGEGLRPQDIGFDAAVEFPPHGGAVAADDSVEIVKPGLGRLPLRLRRDGGGLRAARGGRVSPLPDGVSGLGQHAAPAAVWHQLRGRHARGVRLLRRAQDRGDARLPERRAAPAVRQCLERMGRGRASRTRQRLRPSLAGDVARRGDGARVALSVVASLDDTPITLIGHPFAPIGMGEQLRSHVAALDAMRLQHGVLDIFRHSARTDEEHLALLGDLEVLVPPGGIRIFHVNGDEVERVLDAFAARGGTFADGWNVIVPAWELPTYPAALAPALRRFDEIWAISGFVQAGLAAAGLESHVVGQSVEPAPGPLLPRRWFGVRDSAFVLLHMLDLSSYAARKNPHAALALFAALRDARPWADLQLVLKVKDAEQPGAAWSSSILTTGQTSGVHVIDQPLDSLAVRSLVAASDCLVSLHRAEGFGRGLGEAMALGRLALGTGWSGNLDFMTVANSLLVPHRTVAVRHGEYPHARGQHWAEPDAAAAAAMLLPMLDDREQAFALADRGRRDVLRTHGRRAVGLRILDRLLRIVENMARPATATASRRRRSPAGRC